MENKVIRGIIENSKEPLIINNVLNWNILQWDLLKWESTLQDTELQFRLGDKSCTEEPQWESTTKVLNGTFKEFLTFIEGQTDKWLYFDYKYLNTWLVDKEELRNAIKWDIFDLTDKSANDSTIWIGNQGAHTPCHADTYGYNIVAQVYGKKLWLLFPPEENLLPTRVPYEESSIFSKINFYSPNVQVAKGLSRCRKVILEPGQVLIVPNGWWHYVENLETAISINLWVPLEKDVEKRVDEAITHLIVKLFTSQMDNETKNSILNPNENLETSLLDNINLVKESIKSYQNCNKKGEYDENFVRVKHPNVENIAELSNAAYKSFIRQQAERFPHDNKHTVISDCSMETFINAFAQTNVINELKANLLNMLRNK